MDTKKFTRAYVKEMGDSDGLLVSAIGSTADVDRYGEVVDQSSWDLKHFKQNPVILWAHNLTMGEDRPPIGKATKVKVENGQLVFNIQFDMADPFAADIYRKYKEGYLNAFSVGFISHKVQRSTDNEDNVVLMDNELLELSAVPVPANPKALNQLRARSFSVRSWSSMVKEVEAEQTKEIDDADKEIVEDEVVEEKNAEETESTTDTPTEKVSDPEEQPTITDIVTEEVEDKGGADSTTPEKSELGAVNPQLVRVLRETSKIVSDALHQINLGRKTR